jgi:hypothetical protein
LRKLVSFLCRFVPHQGDAEIDDKILIAVFSSAEWQGKPLAEV